MKRHAIRTPARRRLTLINLEDRTVPTTFFVASDGTDSNNGTSPTTPFRTLQRTFTAAEADTDPGGTEIRVQAGTYLESVPATLSIRFFDQDNVRLLGGWDDTFTTRAPGTSVYVSRTCSPRGLP
jgi:hypothetical protein